MLSTDQRNNFLNANKKLLMSSKALTKDEKKDYLAKLEGLEDQQLLDLQAVLETETEQIKSVKKAKQELDELYWQKMQDISQNAKKRVLDNNRVQEDQMTGQKLKLVEDEISNL